MLPRASSNHPSRIWSLQHPPVTRRSCPGFRRGLWLWVVVANLTGAVAVAEQNNPPTLIEADVISGIPDIELKIQGRASLRRADTQIQAENIDYNYEQDRVRAIGQVQLNHGGNIFSGTELDLSIGSFTGFFSQPSYRLLRGGGYGTASRIEFQGEYQSLVQQANYTTCTAQPGPSWLPEWLISARQLEIDQIHNEIHARGASLRFKDITVPVPDISFPLNDSRKSGLLPPLVGVDTVNGLTYIQPYYFNLAPNRDATLTTNYYARRGVGLGGEFRYLLRAEPEAKGEFRLNVLPQDELRGGQRWALSQQHTSATVWRDHSLDLNMNLNRVSDDNYWKDFPASSLHPFTQRLLANDVSIGSRRGEWSMRLRSLRWQTLQDIDAPITPPYDRSPQLNINFARFDETLDVAWSNDYTLFSADRLQSCFSGQSQNSTALLSDCQPNVQPNTQRLVSQLRVARPIRYGGLSWTPQLSLHGRRYQYDNSGLGSGTRPPQGLLIPTLSLDIKARLERNTSIQGEDWVQTLEPRLFWVNTPYRDQSGFPVYDSARYDFNLATVFTENAYTGHDRIADSRFLTMGMISRFYKSDDGTEGAQFGVAQRLRLDDQRVLLPGEKSINDRWSDILLGAKFNLTPEWLIDSSLQFNPKTRSSERITAGLRYNPSAYRLTNVSYHKSKQFQSDLLALAWQWPLNDRGHGQTMQPGAGMTVGRWYSVARLNYSLNNKKLPDALFGFEYDEGCWLGRVVLQQQQLGYAVNNRRIMFQLELSGLGRVGSNPLQQLREQISGYQNLRPQYPGIGDRSESYD